MKQYDGIKDEELISRFKNGESEILDYLMEKYKNMVRKKARTMFLIGGENDDLIQEGMIGLFKAVRDYQPDRGVVIPDLCQYMCGQTDLQRHPEFQQAEAPAAEFLYFSQRTGWGK